MGIIAGVMDKKVNTLKLAASITVCLLAGYIGSVFTASSLLIWYANLEKPSFNPPGWVFAPVWTVLYVMMGVSAYLVWREGLWNKDVKISLGMFGIQLALNVLWSFLFFGLRSPLYALVEISALWAAIAFTAVIFHRVSRTAGLLLVPYLLWVSFAAVLNFSIWKLN